MSGAASMPVPAAARWASRLRVGSAWLVLLLGCAAALTAVDTFLIARSTDLFHGGFLVVEPQRSAGNVALFLAESLELDVTLLLLIWLVTLPLLGRTRILGAQRLVAAAVLGLAPPLAFLYVRYHLSRYLGELMDPGLWLALAGGSPLEWFAQAEAQLLPVAGTVGVALVAAVFALRALRSQKGARDARGSYELPAALALLVGFLATSVVAAGLLSRACAHGGASCEALEKKAAGAALVPLFERATDFDFDGYGMFSPLADQAPFDPTRHPYALDIPGDGIDQNGLAGDHPKDYQPPADQFVESPVFARQPNMLIIFLEGVRADIIGTQLNGKPVTPFLDQLIAEGSHSEHAYTNSPYTARSRGQLLGGRLAPYRDQSTLIDDFHANGYTVAWISGQDESFGADESKMLGIARTDFHFDARDEANYSVARFNTTGSLMVSWKRVNLHVAEFLEKRERGKPVLLYVNYGDTHFPYDHRELDDVLGVRRLSAREIRPENAKGVYGTYANATANVDRAIQQLLEIWTAKLGAENSALLVTSDHGEAMFEDGTLGHGLALDATQTRVPFVLVGLGGTWPEPLGLSDVRAALQRALGPGGDSPPRARFVPVPGRHILQYMAVIENPRLLCLRGYDTELRYDTTQRSQPDDPEFRSLIWWWEGLQLENAANGPPD
ncbi:MAG TPA: sulfatase-like hydrolase/transferase [Myxococcota bacterium]|nr:sulfatase-like hydrolase/transferase [Myxococcota bacterium]